MAEDARPGPLDRWYQAAGVRTGVRRMFRDETDQGKVFFPDGLVPYLRHEAVRELPPQRRRELTLRHLYQFLLATTHLETRIVNRAAELIADGRSGVELPHARRLDAYKVYCDEGYHSLYSLDLAVQAAEVTGVAIPRWDYGGFVDRLQETGARMLPDHPQLVPLLQVVVFETLITAVLNEVPKDERVVSTVRDITRDHAHDEGHHHRFFAGFFHQLWTQLDGSARGPVALTLPALIESCLLWDLPPVVWSLELAGLDTATAQEVVRDSYGGAGDSARIRDICQATVRVCRSAGVLEVPGAEDAFAARGLIA